MGNLVSKKRFSLCLSNTLSLSRKQSSSETLAPSASTTLDASATRVFT